MGSKLLPSSAFLRAIFLALWIFPELVLAKHAGITRHYKFDVRVTFQYFRMLCMFLKHYSKFLYCKIISPCNYVLFCYCFADQVTKCDKTLPNKEHCDR
jgi:hypothetical protein